MSLDHSICYEALKSRDARFDGVFFTAVKSTGIYCRPICPALTPKSVNCTFYKTAAEAELAGYRPCLRCRPELAPGYADVEQQSLLLKQAIELESDLWRKGLKAVAEALGITTRHLHRLFKEQLGVTPSQYWQTRRLLAAKQLLTDTKLSILQIVEAAGFRSLSTLNESFQKHYKMPPTRLRKQQSQNTTTPRALGKLSIGEDSVRVQIGYRPPFNWQMLLSFFEQRAILGVEWVSAEQGFYRRTVSEPAIGWLEVTHSQHALNLQVSASLVPHLVRMVERVRQTFDLNFTPECLPKGISSETRLPGTFNPFEMAVRAILGQQITVKAARTLAHRLVLKLGDPFPENLSPWPELTHTFPQPTAFMREDLQECLGNLGIIRSRTHAIAAISEAMLSGQIQLNRHMPPETLRKQLLTIKGIGQWTADYIIMRTTGWPDVFLPTDIGVLEGLSRSLGCERKALRDDMTRISNYYKPWRSYLVLSLWQDTFRLSDCAEQTISRKAVGDEQKQTPSDSTL